MLAITDSGRRGITFFSPRSPFKTAKTAEASITFLIDIPIKLKAKQATPVL